MTTKRNMKKDEQAVSPVIAVIMLIAITVVIAAVVAAFAYGIIGSVNKAPSTALVVEGAVSGFNPTDVTIIHHGGDKILDAFNTSYIGDNSTDPWADLEVRYNGATVQNGTEATDIMVNDGGFGNHSDFIAGDEVTILFGELSAGDSITIVYTPTENVLQRITVT